MSEEQQPNRAWKRQVVPCGPEWMTASVARLEETRAETLDSARKRQREAESAEPAAESSGSGLQTTLLSQESLPPPVAEDVRRFRHVTMTPASFIPQRHLFMCAGRPMVVPCFMYSPTPPSFLMPSLCDAPKEAPQHNPMVWDCTGALSMHLLLRPMHHSKPLPNSLRPFSFQSLLCVYSFTPMKCTAFVVRSSS